MVPASYCWHKSMEPLMAQVRELMGDCPVYITFDIDGIDPGYAPGTGKFLYYAVQSDLLYKTLLCSK